MTPEKLKKAQVRISRYCAFAERSPKQVKEKLKKYGLTGSEIEKVVSLLRDENYINESRFAHAFVHDKLKFNKWGKNRLKMELISHQIPEDCIAKALESVDEDEYHKIIKSLLVNKVDSIKAGVPFLSRKKKVIDFLMQKGFESGIVFKLFDEIMSDRQQ
jgi:regulatory protein